MKRSSRLRLQRVRLRRALPRAAAPLLLLASAALGKTAAPVKPRRAKPTTGQVVLTRADTTLRARISASPIVYLGGSGPLWRRLTGFKASSKDVISIADKGLLRELVETLRCRDQEKKYFYQNPGDNWIDIGCTRYDPQFRHPTFREGYFYVPVSSGRTLMHYDARDVDTVEPVQAPCPPRFEAWVARMARTARARKSRKVVLRPSLYFLPWMADA